MYEGLSWSDYAPFSSQEQSVGGAGDGYTDMSTDYGWMDWGLADMDPLQFSTENNEGLPQGFGGRGSSLGRNLDEDALLNYLTKNNLQLKETSLGNNTGYRAAFNKDTGKIQGNPTLYDLNDNFMQGALMLAAPMLAPAAVGNALFGATGGLGTFLGGGTIGATGSMLTGNNPLQGFALGGLGSFMPDVAGYAGVTNDFAKGVVNKGLAGAATSAIQGGDVGRGAITGAAGGALSGLGGLFTSNGGMPDVGTMSGESADGTTYDMVAEAPTINYWGAPNAAVGATTRQAMSESPVTAAMEQSNEGGGLWDNVSSLLGFNGTGGVAGTKLQFGDLVQGLAGLYGYNRQRRNAKELMNTITGRRGAYEANLRSNLQRRDAAEGRRSDYSGRETQLQAALAELDSRNAPLISQLNQSRDNGLAQLLQTGLRLGSRAGWLPNSSPSMETRAMPSMSGLSQMFDSNPYSLMNTDPLRRKLGGS